MSNVTLVLAQAKALSEQEQQELLTQLEEYLVLGSQVSQVTKEVKEMKFSKGRVCCHCNGTDVVRNGKRNGVQRYLCRNCQKSFTEMKFSLLTLIKELNLLICQALLVREVNKSRKDVLVKSKCVGTALDRQGNIIIELLCTGRVTANELERLYSNRIGEHSILCTDSHKSYIQFAIDMKLDHKRIKRGRHKEDIYHINHINSLHSNLKKWMARFNGVATKYLEN